MDTAVRLITDPVAAKGVRDQFGRRMNYLRISLTDRCNFRCLYCMPAIGMKFQPRDEMLSDEELIRVVGLCAQLGFTKLRLTGGEPTIRPHLVDLVREMKAFPGIKELSMTTNALLMGRLAGDLKEAGLDRVNVSIDTLDPVKFKSMTRGGRFDLVWQGIQAAEEAGLTPIKLNTVVVRDQNDHDVAEMARLTIDRPWQVRFLEIMPMEGVGVVYDEGLVTSAGGIGSRSVGSGPHVAHSGRPGHDRVHLPDLRAVLRNVQPGSPDFGWQSALVPLATG